MNNAASTEATMTTTNWSKRAQEILDSDDFDARVSELMTLAGQAGDARQVELCELALGCGDAGHVATQAE